MEFTARSVGPLRDLSGPKGQVFTILRFFSGHLLHTSAQFLAREWRRLSNSQGTHALGRHSKTPLRHSRPRLLTWTLGLKLAERRDSGNCVQPQLACAPRRVAGSLANTTSATLDPSDPSPSFTGFELEARDNHLISSIALCLPLPSRLRSSRSRPRLKPVAKSSRRSATPPTPSETSISTEFRTSQWATPRPCLRRSRSSPVHPSPA